MHVIASSSADEAWRVAVDLVLRGKNAVRQPSRIGETIEVLHVALELTDPSQRWIVSRTPAMNPAFALVETLWLAAGRRDAALLNYWNPVLPKYCGFTTNYHGAYGYRLRHHLGIDQLDRVYQVLINAPDSRQCVLQIWDSSVDLPNADGTPVNPDIPCNVFALLKVRQGKLEWLQVIRSNDLFLGVPHNVVQFTTLQEILTGWLGIVPGTYIQLSDSLHVYSKDIEAVRSSLSAVALPRNVESFALDRATWDRAILDVFRRLEPMARDSLSPKEFRSIAFCRDVPAAYDNSVLIAAADAARRRRWADLAAECSERCTNPTLVVLWKRWLQRCEGVSQAH